MTWFVRGSASCRTRRIENCAHGKGVGFFFCCSPGRRGVSSSMVVAVMSVDGTFTGMWGEEGGGVGEGIS